MDFSIIADPRLPIYFPINYIRWQRLSKELDAIDLGDRSEIDFLLTVDVEYDYGSLGSQETRCIAPFLQKVKTLFDKHGIHATLFIQGNLVEPFAAQLSQLGTTHEIGLHGYAHESWGKAWFAKGSAPTKQECQKMIDKSFDAFNNAGIKRPIAFRAPNMVLGKEPAATLKKYGFRVDSSFPSYFGGEAIKRTQDGLLEVPVSFDPRPVFSRFGIAHHTVFNTYNISNESIKSNLAESAIRLAKLQALRGQKPFVVFLCHPWEFFEMDPRMPKDKLGYSSPDNLSRIGDFLSKLGSSFKLNFKTLAEFEASS